MVLTLLNNIRDQEFILLLQDVLRFSDYAENWDDFWDRSVLINSRTLEALTALF